MKGKPRIAVLYGDVPPNAPPDEKDALIEAEAVAAALRSSGYQPMLRAVTTNLEKLQRELMRLRPALVFNLVESLDGHGAFIAWVPQLLERLGISYTGVGADAQFLTSNKLLAKRWLAGNGIATPAWSEDGSTADSGPWIVKSVWEHASIGIDDEAIVSGGDAIRKRIALQRELHGGAWFAERFVDGREFNIALLEDATGVRILPIAEIDFSAFPDGKPRIVNYAAKWDDAAFEFQHTPRRFMQPGIETALASKLQGIGRSCWQLFGLRGYARVDVRVDDQGEPLVLEINTNPCLTPDAGFAAAAAEAGMDYAELVGHIVASVRLPDSAAGQVPRQAVAQR